MKSSETLSKKQLELLKEFISKPCTDSGVRDFCEEHKIPLRAAYHQIAIWYAPEECIGCVNIEMRPSMPPCPSCRRGKKDLYEPENTEEKEL